MTLIRDVPEFPDPAQDLAFAQALVRQASQGEIESAQRVYRPRVPMVVFGRRDTRLPGFPAAVDAAREAGFTPAIRATGGRAVAYTQNALVVDEVRRQPGAMDDQELRFQRFGESFAKVFRSLGVDARMGPVPGEYCPGAHSVNARGVAKLVGTSQRVVRDAWLFSSLVVLDDRERLQAVLVDVYAQLGLPFDPGSVGSLASEGAGEDAVDRLEQTILEHWSATRCAGQHDVDRTVSIASRLVDQFRVEAHDAISPTIQGAMTEVARRVDD